MALPTVTALTAQEMITLHLFVVQVIVGTTHGDTQYSVNKQHIEYQTFIKQKLSVYAGSS